MRTRVPSLKSFNAHEQERLMMPLLGFTLALVGIIFGASLLSYFQKDYEQAFGLLQGTIWGLYVLAIHLVIVHRKWEIDRYRWILPILNGIGIGFLIHSLPSNVALLALYFYLASIFIYCITAGRGATYAVILSTAGIYVLLESLDGFSSPVLIIAFSFVSSGIVMAELLLRLFNVIMFRARRLDIVNDFARKIALSIESSQVLTLLNAAIESAMDADTYFVAMLDDDGKIRLDLFYDDGEFFPPMTLDGQGTLSGWVLRNRRPLFLPDLRSEPDLEGVTVTIIGRERTSLSWMGVPILSSHFTGLISIASYTPNAFDRMDMELLENLAQHAASAMENAFHHAEVERQSQTDSLTGALNHGAFLLALERLAEDTQPSGSPLSLIMLDVDFFKSYNDTYGHLFGDKVLQALTQTIREHIKGQDVVGRWGGEEFAVILPHTTGANAILVARRIQDTMYQMRMEHPEKGLVPAPTVSQGIAVYPLEIRDVYQLVDIADHRLYLAKERGRNQVEPQEDAWMIPGTDEQGTDTDELESRTGYY